MTSNPDDADLPVVPGLAPADGRTRPLRPSGGPGRVDPSSDASTVFDPEKHRPRVLGAADDPDRFDPDRVDGAGPTLPPTSRRLDPAQDPDRYLPPGQGQSLTDLLGKAGAHEEERDNWQWAFGLLGVLAFLALVAWLFGSVLTP